MKALLISAGILFILTGIFVFFAHSTVYGWLFLFYEQYVDKDNQVAHILFGQRILVRNLQYMAVLCLIIGAFTIGLVGDSFRSRIRNAFLTDHIYQSDSSILKPRVTLILSSLTGLLLTALFLAQDSLSLSSLYKEDGFFENLTAIGFLVSAGFMCISALSMRRASKLRMKNDFLWVFRVDILLIVLFFFIAMEEISWGQRIFGWETPNFLAKINYQNETNLHNLYNHSFTKNFYTPLVFLFPVVLISVLLRFMRQKLYFFYRVLPRPALIVLACLITLFSLLETGLYLAELVEELTALFVLFYSLRVVKSSGFISE